MPFSVTLERVPDRELGPLLIQLAQAGRNPIIKPADADSAAGEGADPARGLSAHLAEDWRLVQEREGQSYQWPNSASATCATACSWCTARRRRGSDRTWRDDSQEQVGARPSTSSPFLSSGAPQRPLAEFVAADDYEDTRELVAVIRGSDGGRRMYGAGDALPWVYTEGFRPAVQRAGGLSGRLEQGHRRRAREDDDQTMLNHALIQAEGATRT